MAISIECVFNTVEIDLLMEMDILLFWTWLSFVTVNLLEWFAFLKMCICAMEFPSGKIITEFYRVLSNRMSYRNSLVKTKISMRTLNIVPFKSLLIYRFPAVDMIHELSKPFFLYSTRMLFLRGPKILQGSKYTSSFEDDFSWLQVGRRWRTC